MSGQQEEVLYAGSLDAALERLATDEFSHVETVFVIGGGQVYSEAVAHPGCEAIHYTLVETKTPCDTHFPEIDSKRFKVRGRFQGVGPCLC